MRLASLTALGDPCPLPDALKKRSLSDRERKVYAPLCGLGGVIIDKDAIYIDTGTSHASEKVRLSFRCCNQEARHSAESESIDSTSDEFVEDCR